MSALTLSLVQTVCIILLQSYYSSVDSFCVGEVSLTELSPIIYLSFSQKDSPRVHVCLQKQPFELSPCFLHARLYLIHLDSFSMCEF